MKTKSDTVKNVCKVVMLPVFVYLLFFICSGGAFGKPASLIMNLKQTLAPTLISFAMCSNMLCNRMDLSAGAVVMLSAMFGAKNGISLRNRIDTICIDCGWSGHCTWKQSQVLCICY
mgnify:CR=1 FL=1